MDQALTLRRMMKNDGDAATDMAGYVLITVSSEPESITDSYALIKMLSQKYGIKMFKLRVSLAAGEKEGREVFIRIRDAADRFLNVKVEYVGSVPVDFAVKKSGSNKKASVSFGAISKNTLKRRI